jgi:hypothetical protein
MGHSIREMTSRLFLPFLGCVHEANGFALSHLTYKLWQIRWSTTGLGRLAASPRVEAETLIPRYVLHCQVFPSRRPVTRCRECERGSSLDIL